MADESDPKPNSSDESLDLSSLSSLSLGPDWGSAEKPRGKTPQERGTDREKGSSTGPRRQEGGRRGPPRRRHSESGGGPRKRDVPRHRESEPFQPVVAVDFYPEEEPFKVLINAIRHSCRTYELFEIARLILDKPERFVCVARDPLQKEGEPARLFASVPDGLPFRSEEEALSHVFRFFLGDFFDLETVEAEPPSGSFQMVHKCGMTGEIIGPPNFHRYQALLKEHHAANLQRVPFDKMVERLESSREEEDINAWLERMKTQTHYRVKGQEDTVLTTPEDARLYLLTHSKEKLVRPAYSARFSGRVLSRLPDRDPIRLSVEHHLEQQKRFPLDTANHLRGRLRRLKFAVYKRGSKGVSYVCAVKRRFRRPDEVMADNLQELIDFIEAHPNFPAKDLPKTFLGIRGADAPSPVAPQEGAEAEPPSEQEKPSLSEDEKKALAQLRNDLRYLVSEGYVIEYSDGRLFVPPVRQEEINRVEKEKQGKEHPEAAEKESTEESEPDVGSESPAKEQATAEYESSGNSEAAVEKESATENEPAVENESPAASEASSGEKESPIVPDPEATEEPLQEGQEEPPLPPDPEAPASAEGEDENRTGNEREA